MTIEEYGVYKIMDGDFFTGHWGVIQRDCFKRMNLCETYSRYGEQIGCTDAACNTPDNIYHREYCQTVLKSIRDEFNSCKDCKCYKHCPEGNDHSMADAYTYWDGHNFTSLILSYLDYSTGLTDVEEEELDKSNFLLSLVNAVTIDDDVLHNTVYEQGYPITFNNYRLSPYLFVIGQKEEVIYE